MQKRIWATLAWCVLSTGLFAQPVASLTTPPMISSPSAIDVNSLDATRLRLTSNNAMVVDTETGRILFSKNPTNQAPIASITKLMTAMVTLDARLSLDEPLTITTEDADVIKNTGSRLRYGTTLSRREMLRLALMSSENRAASALGRHYPGGITAFVQAMNKKAASLGMVNTHFVDSSGLSSSNQSTVEDLVRMVHAAVNYQPIRDFSTTSEYWIEPAPGQRVLNYRNSNALMRDPNWDIVVSKTGFINEAGRCLVMVVRVSGHPITIVMLDANGKQARLSDAQRIKQWVGGHEFEGPGIVAASETRKRTYRKVASSKKQSKVALAKSRKVSKRSTKKVVKSVKIHKARNIARVGDNRGV